MTRQDSNLSRRAFLGAGATAATTAAALGAPSLADATRRKPKKHHHKHKKPAKPKACVPYAPQPAAAPPGGRIDLHGHHIPPVYRTALLGAGVVTIGGYPTPPWSPAEAISFMDNYGIGTQVLSLSDPGVSFLSGSAAATLARQVNEYTASVLQDHPSRFGGLAVLPLPDIDAALSELEYALDTLKLDGVGLLSSYASSPPTGANQAQGEAGGNTTAGPQFSPIWEELNRRKAFVFMHPTALPSDMKPPSLLPDFLVEFTFETTRFVATALNTGLFTTFPDLRVQLAHAGGCFPYLAYRVSVIGKGVSQFLEPSTTTTLGIFPTQQTKGLYYDTALNPAPSAMRSILEITDLEHIVFGSDWPFTQLLFMRSGDPQPELSLTFEEKQRHVLERGNALKQLPTLAKRLAKA